ncbi:DUF58 domain-containing protein [Agromyces intestinalis]|uniref:DUF58 domain-containing protein n=1 Tax=Agromyces intestinalis TaxID=2592652 RepID=A0A5C1YJE6_9MICO|nr:DUF58 domain-containing protein [Agromyces intestinalis]QEO15708.1 DUF58 domain-containing protein [Agromyces intestinalis]
MSRPSPGRAASLPRLTGRGGTLVVVGVVLVAVALWFDLRDVLLLAFAAIAVPLAALAFVGVRMPQLAVRRAFTPHVGSAGSTVEVRVEVRNRSSRTLDGAMWSDTAPSAMHTPPEAVLPALGAHERIAPRGDDLARLSYRMPTPWRGVFAIGPLRVTTTDPFGLARAMRPVDGAHELVVTPRVTRLDPMTGTGASLDGVLHGLQRRTHPNSDEFIAREYRYGDPLRRVNWPATARRGELMVRDEEQRGDPEARILVDAGPGGVARTGDGARHAGFELAIELVASIGVHLLGQGFRLRVDRVADPTRGAVDTGATAGYRMPGGDRVLLEDLARLEAEDRGHARAVGGGGGPVAAAGTPVEGRMPGYAVLVDPDASDVAQLVALRPALSPAVAFVLESVRPSMVRLLEDADWQVTRVRRAADIADAWAGIGGTRGRTRTNGGGSDAS